MLYASYQQTARIIDSRFNFEPGWSWFRGTRCHVSDMLRDKLWSMFDPGHEFLIVFPPQPTPGALTVVVPAKRAEEVKHLEEERRELSVKVRRSEWIISERSSAALNPMKSLFHFVVFT